MTAIETIRFTGKERDAETGLDYFGARYFSGAQGRFTSPDPIVHPAQSQAGMEIFLSEPQRWNKYAYVSNNPLKYTDPNGAEQVVGCVGGSCYNNLTGQVIPRQSTADGNRTMLVPLGGMAIAAGGSWGASSWIGRAILGYFLTPNGQETAQNAIEAVGPPGASLRLIPTGDIDRAAVSLAENIGGQASVRIEGLAAREFDAVSKDFVAQTFSSANAALKPENFLNKTRREQIRATFDAAKQTGRKAYFEFTGGKLAQEVLDFLKRNAERIGADYEVH